MLPSLCVLVAGERADSSNLGLCPDTTNQLKGNYIMCDLCSNLIQVREKEQTRLNNVADKLYQLAHDYQELASGELKPHSKEIQTMSIRSKSIIRSLVEEWI